MINVKDIKQSEEFFYYIEDKCRFVIGQKKGTPLICIGLNPSTATPSAPDPTYCKLMKIATNEKNNFDSTIVFNLYPYIATEPKDLPKQEDEEIIQKNIDVIKTVLNEFEKCKEPITICACWGAGIEKRTYLKECLNKIYKTLNASGKEIIWKRIDAGNYKHPHHPLYMDGDIELSEFTDSIATYIKEISKSKINIIRSIVL